MLRLIRARGTERQQLKWVAYAAGLAAGSLLTSVAVFLLSGTAPVALEVLVSCMLVAIPVAAAVAILRYRLYDIDRIINRTLVYGLLTAMLGMVYAGAVLLLGQLFGRISANPSSWAVASATLAVAALFQPARRRVQGAVDRRFNRQRYDAAKTVEEFRDHARDHVDLDMLTAELLGAVDRTVQPSYAAVWLRPTGSSDRP